jgi:enoyl-CoA hydratase/carnithine racemase
MMEVRLARHGRDVAIVTIDNQPRLNALTRAMLTELGRLWDELECDGSCRAIVLTGAARAHQSRRGARPADGLGDRHRGADRGEQPVGRAVKRQVARSRLPR